MGIRTPVTFNRPDKLLLLLLSLLFCQLLYGAFMAGTHAALQAPTWPDINGSIIPSGLITPKGIFDDLFYNPLLIQLVHRGLAYIIIVLILIFYFRAGKLPIRAGLRKFRWVPLTLVFTQAILGILALIKSAFPSHIFLSVLHQFVGMLLLMSVVTANFLCQKMQQSCKHIGDDAS